MPKRNNSLKEMFVPIDGSEIGCRMVHQLEELERLISLKGWLDPKVERLHESCKEEYGWNTAGLEASGALVTAYTFLATSTPLTVPFCVLSCSDDDGLMVAHRFEATDLDLLNSAVNGDRAMKWPSGKFMYCDYCYLFGPQLWQQTSSEEHLDLDEWTLTLKETVDKERRNFERLKQKFSADPVSTPRRAHIPEEIRIFVWRRDGGRCVQCGSQENLEYDHVIPVVSGGSNTARNIQILCESCNRRKGHRP